MLIYFHNCLEGKIYKRLKRSVQMNHRKTQSNLVIELNRACSIGKIVNQTTGLMIWLTVLAPYTPLDQTLADFAYPAMYDVGM